MILAETKEFTIECDVDDEVSRDLAQGLADIYGKYSLEGNDNLDPIVSILQTAHGEYRLLVRYKKLN